MMENLTNPIWQKVFNLQNTLLRDTDDWVDNMPNLTHHFGPNVYIREIFMEAKRHKIVIGCMHKTEHFNIVLTGRASVLMDPETGEWQEIKAPCIFISKPGVKKVLEIHEDMRWLTVHPLAEDKTEADMDELEEMLVVEKPSKIHKEALIQRELRQLARERDKQRRLA